MSSSTQIRPVVLVVEAEAVFNDLQASVGATTAEVVLAPHPAQARIIAGSRLPALLVLPTPAGEALQARTLRRLLPAHARILGLVGDQDGLNPPAGVDRVVRLKDRAGVQAAVELLLEESQGAAPQAPSGGLGAVNEQFDQALGGEPPPAPGSSRAPADASPEEPEADVDPARAAAIRDLGVAIRMQRTLSGGAGASSPAPALGISLSQVGRDDPSQVDISVGSTRDALSSLPDPSKAVSAEDYRAQLAETRGVEQASERDRQAAADALAQIRTHKERRDPTEMLELAVVKRQRKRRLVLGVSALLAVLVAGGVGGTLYWRHRQAAKARASRKPPPEVMDETLISRAESARKRGTLVDPFSGLIVRTPEGIRASDVDNSDEQLNRSVPELDKWFELALKRLSARKAREQLMQRAEPLVKFEDYKKARYYLDRALKIRDGVDARELLATAYEKQGHLAEARHQLRKALSLARRRADLRVRLAQLYLKEGKTKQGCAELKLAIRRARKHRGLYREKCESKGGAR